MSTHSSTEIEYAFETFVEGCQRLIDEHFAARFTNLTPPEIVVHPGRVYWKVVSQDAPDEVGRGQSSVFGFVRKADGAIFKPATWKAPFTKGETAIRGNVTDHANGLESVTPYGVVYAR